jgi:hypothetical protein
MRVSMMLFAIGALVVGLPAAAEHGWDRPLPEPVPHPVDSGSRPNDAVHSHVVWSNTVHKENAGWLRLYFGPTELGQGSFLRITSLTDGETQVLDAAELARWSNTSGYFNGDTVLVELVAGPHTQVNRWSSSVSPWRPRHPPPAAIPAAAAPTTA